MLVLSRNKELLLIISLAILIRVIFHFTYLPWWCGDSGGYLGARAFFTADLQYYDAGRTPGYVFLVAVAHFITHFNFHDIVLSNNRVDVKTANAVVYIQAILGIATVYFLFCIFELLKFPRLLKLIGALFFAVLAGSIRSEWTILPEALSTFMFVLSVYLLVISISFSKREIPIYWGIFTGLICGFSILVRPNNLVFYIVFLCFFIALSFVQVIRKQKLISEYFVRTGVLIALTAAFPVSLLMAINYGNTGEWMLTPMVNITRVFTAYNLFNKVPKADKEVGSIMYKYYLLSNRSGEIKRDYLWQALPEIRENVEKMPFQTLGRYNPGVYLAKYLGKVSTHLLVSNPKAWLTNGLSNFKDTLIFYEGPPSIVSSGDPISVVGTTVVLNNTGYRLIDDINKVESYPLLITYILTYCCFILACYNAFFKKKSGHINDPLLAAMALGAMASFISPCFLAAYYPRFGIPYYAVLIVCTCYLIHEFSKWVGRKRRFTTCIN